MLDIASLVRVHVVLRVHADALIAAQNDMGVCDAIRQKALVGKPTAMSAPHLPKVAGIDPTVPVSAHTAGPLSDVPSAPGAFIQDRLVSWISDLTTLHELTERLARTGTLDDALHELLDAGAALVGARRGLVVFEPSDRRGPVSTIGLGLAHADLGQIETVPRTATTYGRILEGLPDTEGALTTPDLLGDTGLDPRRREVAARLGYAASYAVPITAEATGRLGAAVWLYDEPAEPLKRQRHLVGLYAGYAGEHLARLLELERARADVATVAEELLPSRLPRVAACTAGRPPPQGRAGRRRLVRRARTAGGCARSRRGLGERLRAERPGRHGTAAGRPAGVRGDGGRGSGRRALGSGTAAAAHRTGPYGDRAVRLLRTGRAQDPAGRLRATPRRS